MSITSTIYKEKHFRFLSFTVKTYYMMTPQQRVYHSYWDSKRICLAKYRKSGNVHLEPWGNYLWVSAPFKVEFRDFANSVGAKYYKKTIRWAFLRSQREELIQQITKIYGEHALIEKIL